MTRSFPAHAGKRPNPLTAKFWEYRNVLNDSGLSTIEFAEQLSYLVFLKTAYEITKRSFPDTKTRAIVPVEYDWGSLLEKSGEDLNIHYRAALAELAKSGPDTTVGSVFTGAQNRIADSGLLRKLMVDLNGALDWNNRTIDLVADAFEDLLARAAEDVKSGAGQYFTPRSLIKAIVDAIQPQPTDTITDPACGTGGYLIAAHDYILEHHAQGLPSREVCELSSGRIWGHELVPATARLAMMNMLLHGLGSAAGPSLITTEDALQTQPNRHASLVLTHPPFGMKSTITTADRNGTVDKEWGPYKRNDFPVITYNKQINFLQHIMSLLDINGRAAVIVPDNILFEGGKCTTLRRRLLQDFDLHTILRLPAGVFYAAGVKANVLFFDKKPRVDNRPHTSKLWVYDLRTDKQFSRMRDSLQPDDLAEFVEAYLPGKSPKDRVETQRFRCFDYSELTARDLNLDLAWAEDPTLDDPFKSLPPGLIAEEIVYNLQVALDEFSSVAKELSDEIPPHTDLTQ
ncbi:HsdM family class I SAM-dependent methyltransferase [Streptomyces sasae]|uniref:HsdM family class I SAM-dependent methyltransferase n=1 Tax=Streptomyces sasae TaxID=1266772 RepID=UPI00292F4858|nr:class I SAM-dependent DNA methyltransferase [Streptomyces sasae]